MLSSAGSGPGYDTVFSVVLMCTLQRSDAGCKSPPTIPTSPSALFLLLWPILRCAHNYATGQCVMVQLQTRVSMGGVSSSPLCLFICGPSDPLLLRS